MWTAALLIFVVHLVYADHHSLQYFYTGTTGMADFPQFVALGMVDGKQIDYYDSVIGKNVLKQAWMEGTRDENRITNIRRGHQATYSNSIKVIMERFNQTLGVHTYQKMYGCEWDDQTGATNAFKQYGYDGGDFMSLDFKEMRWISPVQQGTPTVQKWNNDKGFIESQKNYYSTVCIEWLQKYVRYGKDTLERKVSPQVSLLQKSPSSSVSCHATGFFPSGVTISWQKNKQDHDEDVDLGELITNEDGTFQRTSSITVTPEEWKKNVYECVVEHKSRTIRSILTEDKIKTNYDSSASVPIFIILAAVAGVLLLIVTGVAGYKVYQKKKGFKPVNASDDGSNSSARSDPKA